MTMISRRYWGAVPRNKYGSLLHSLQTSVAFKMSVLICKALVLLVELFLPLPSETRYEQCSSQTYMKSRVTTNTTVYNWDKVLSFCVKIAFTWQMCGRSPLTHIDNSISPCRTGRLVNDKSVPTHCWIRLKRKRRNNDLKKRFTGSNNKRLYSS